MVSPIFRPWVYGVLDGGMGQAEVGCVVQLVPSQTAPSSGPIKAGEK
jgi:hypothetical protein